MPGISLKCDLNKKNTSGHNNNGDELFLNELNSVIYNDYYKREILLKEDPYLVACTRYPQYPLKIFENTEFWICLEGKIYGKRDSVLDKEINDLIGFIFGTKSTTDNDKNKKIADWLLETDGDYLIYALNKKTKDFIIINDVLGRLPLYYYYKEKKEIIVSREVQFVSHFIKYSDNRTIFDKMGIAQFLLFSHTLGKRTLVSNVYRFEPATLLRIFNNNSEIKIDTLYQFNFENKKYANQSIKKSAQELVSLFSEACKNRVDYNTKNIISLSGGSDSRAIAACFHKNKIPSYTVTSTEPHWRPVAGSISEEEIAEQLSKLFNIEWEDFHIMKHGGQDLVMLLRIKNGLTYLRHSFLLRFLDKIKHKHGFSAITFFTGHGGDMILKDISGRKIINLDNLVSDILRIKGCFSLSEVAALVQNKESEIVDEIRNILSSYSEENLDQKLVHYLVYDAHFKFSIEIEDINRLYFWSVAPFYSVPFFNYAMNCPDENKSQQALYREFLFTLSPLAAIIKNSDWGCSILSRKFRILQFILSLALRYPMLKKIIKKIKDKDKKGYEGNSRIIRCIRDQITNCNDISNYLSPKGLEKIINNSSNYNSVSIVNLFTITSLMEKTLCNNSTIEKYFDN